MKQWKVYLLISCLLAILSGCANPSSPAFQSPTFTYQNIQKGNLAVFGLVAKDNQLTNTDRSMLNQQLAKNLSSKYNAVKITSSNAVLSAIGNQQYQNIGHTFLRTNKISQSSLGVIQSRLPNTRYILIAKIASDDVKRNQDAENSFGSSVTQISFKTTRNIQVALQIYDLRDKTLAFSNTFTSDKTRQLAYQINSNDDLEKDELNDLLNTGTLSVVGGSSQHSTHIYPSKPRMASVIQGVWSQLIQELPA